jgi:hypothetical protein
MFSVASGIALTNSVEGGSAVGAVSVGVGVLSSTSTTINHQNHSSNSNPDLVLRFVVPKKSGWSTDHI